MANDLQQLMEFRQTAPQARLVGSPSHLEVPSAVARAVEGQAQKRERLQAFPLPLGVTLGKAAGPALLAMSVPVSTTTPRLSHPRMSPSHLDTSASRLGSGECRSAFAFHP